jgi:hypothetical protein
MAQAQGGGNRARAERALGPIYAARARAEGAGMTTEEAIAYAVADPAPGRDGSPAGRARCDSTAATH